MARSVTPPIACSLFLVALSACGGATPPAGRPAPAVAVTLPPAAVAAGDPADPLAVTAADPTWGNADASVTLVLFGDFGNAFCAQHAAWIRKIRRQYRPEVLRIVWKSAPRPERPESRRAAEAALAVYAAGGAPAFWAFYDAAFAAYPALSPARYERWAAQAGVPLDRYRRALADPRAAGQVDAGAALAEELGLIAPHVLVNGLLVLELESIEEFIGVIDGEWSAADEAVLRGTPQDQVSRERTRANITDVPITLAVEGRAPAPAEPEAPRVEERRMLGAKHLLVMYKGSSRAPGSITRTRAEARARAEEALKKARQGVRFEDLTRQYSDDPGTASRGGELGRFPQGVMVPEFEAAVLRTPVGALSDVVETPFGFHILLRTE